MDWLTGLSLTVPWTTPVGSMILGDTLQQDLVTKMNEVIWNINYLVVLRWIKITSWNSTNFWSQNEILRDHGETHG